MSSELRLRVITKPADMLRLAKASSEECIAMRVAIERKIRRVRMALDLYELRLERAKICERESKTEVVEIENIMDSRSHLPPTIVCP